MHRKDIQGWHQRKRTAIVLANPEPRSTITRMIEGPLDDDLVPEQAGEILSIPLPLVVQRMEDGRLPFRFVGAQRICKLTDVLALKAREAETTWPRSTTI